MNADIATKTPVLFGAPYSVYVRIVRLTLLEKNIVYELKPVDIFDPGSNELDYEHIHPFNKIPSFQHGSKTIIETGAIARYIDGAFPDPSLVPNDPIDEAAVNQIISVMDNYAYPSMIWGIYVPSSKNSESQISVDEGKAAADTAEKVLSFLNQISDEKREFLAGNSLSLADIYAVPIFFYFLKTDVGISMLKRYPSLERWWTTCVHRSGYADILQQE